jgi:hypothetical protein
MQICEHNTNLNALLQASNFFSHKKAKKLEKGSFTDDKEFFNVTSRAGHTYVQ